MNPFLLGFLSSFLLLVVIFGLLYLFVYVNSKLFRPRPIAYKSSTESTDWLNFILFRVMSHFQTKEAITRINALLADKLGEGRLNILTLGNSPTIPQVKTVAMPQADDIKILVPLEWDGGPSLDFNLIRNRLSVEVDLTHFHAVVMFSWPGSGCTTLEIRFDPDFVLDLHIGLKFGNHRFAITKAPVLGPILTGLATFAISRQVLQIDLPEASLEGLPRRPPAQ
jgi:hypothetical protein